MNIKDIKNLSELAKIKLTEEEEKELLKDMTSTLSYVDQIRSAEVDSLPSDKIEYKQKNIYREDVLRSKGMEDSKNIIKKQFPDSKNGFVKVKKIL